MIHAFGDCELDRGLYELRRRGRAVRIEPKVFDVLAFLLDHRERVVSKDDLLDALWPGEAVSESVLPRSIAAARRAVGDTRARQKVIQTIHGRGYRFVAAVREAERRAADSEPPRAAPPVEAVPEAPFVGRAAAMERLRRFLDSAVAGRGGIVLLVGEPGIGKTRTAEELARVARGRGVRVLVGRSFEGEGAPAFWPWVQILRECVRDLEPGRLATELGADAAEVVQLLPELRPTLPELPPAQGLEGEQGRFRLFDGVASFLRRAARREPLLLVFDDLHWADDASLLLVQFLAPELREERILLVGTYRDVAVRREHPLGRLLGALARETSCERLALRGLSAEDVRHFLAAISGGPAPPALVRSVHEMTDGNPFFVHELVRWLADQGRLGGGDAERPSLLELPQSVRDAIGRRLDGLSEECNALLRVAAVLGREFHAKLLEEVAGLSGDALLEPLGEALDARVLVEAEGGAGRYAFSHALVRQTLHDEIRIPERVRLHRRVGEALEATHGSGAEPPLSELAHHFFEAAPGGDVEKAIAYGIRAAERAHGLLAYEESARLHERTLDLLEFGIPRDGARRFQILVAAGAAHDAAGARGEARRRFEEAAATARRLGRPDLLARAALGYRGFGEMGVPPEPETLALLEEARDALGDGETALRARLLALLVGTPPYSLSMERRDALSREALALARKVNDPAALRDALGARSWACLGPDRVAERFEVGRELLELGESLGDPLTETVAHEYLFGAHLLVGNTAAADRELQEHARLAAELRRPFLRFMSSFLQGSRAVCAGRFDEAEALFRQSRELGRGTVRFADVTYGGQMYWLHFQRGRLEELDRGAAFLREVAERWPGSRNLARSALALVAVGQERPEVARRELEAIAEHDFADLERDEHWLLTLVILSDVAFLVEDRRRAALLYDLLLPHAELVALHDLLRTFAGPVASVLGELATLLERWEAGLAHYEKAIAKGEAMGAQHALLGSRAGLARLLRRRGRAADRRRAEVLLKEVEKEAKALGIEDSARYQRYLRREL